MVGCLGLLHEERQAMVLHRHWAYLVVGLGPKVMVLTMPFFFSTGGLCPSSRGKILCFGTLSMENCRLLMLICSNASVVQIF